MSKRPYNNQMVRIIGGQWKRRRISFASHSEIRPSSDRVRETLFNWLSPHLFDSECLDLFAGSGILGIEALSRGAKRCDFFDSNPLVVSSLESALKNLNTTKGLINQGTFPLININQAYDIIFLDPPFNRFPLTTLLDWVDQHQCLKPKGMIYFESPYSIAAENNHYITLKNQRYGQVHFSLLTQAPQP
ncbi:MAG TPA: 16S rRNA (guanine(966)-N(2))-methyltransferase RsmD [Gammaproteobacteria bacterium]|nr:16S rRNA (guanine(966)-N(2))-methyltransferase RsmD [Gammaproteobacteria bacterium]